uniref:Uncharacterized protein n=1 Tax=Strigamia maritima TaxID=126957 RepID=T1J8V8_STRMM
MQSTSFNGEMYPRTHLWLLVILFFSLARSESEDEQIETADQHEFVADETKSEDAESDDDAFLDSDKKKKLKVSLPLSPRCRHILTVLNFQRRFAKSIDSHAIKAIEKSNGKVVATLVKEHIHNAENTLLSKINGTSQHVRFKVYMVIY